MGVEPAETRTKATARDYLDIDRRILFPLWCLLPEVMYAYKGAMYILFTKHSAGGCTALAWQKATQLKAGKDRHRLKEETSPVESRFSHKSPKLYPVMVHKWDYRRPRTRLVINCPALCTLQSVVFVNFHLLRTAALPAHRCLLHASQICAFAMIGM